LLSILLHCFQLTQQDDCTADKTTTMPTFSNALEATAGLLAETEDVTSGEAAA
jgi:hypothetical protein